jgi:hypothetical protein
MRKTAQDDDGPLASLPLCLISTWDEHSSMLLEISYEGEKNDDNGNSDIISTIGIFL